MDRKLTDIFPWNHHSHSGADNKLTSSLDNQFVLCLDRNPCGGDFAFDIMLSSMLSKGTTVILLALNHTRQHYELVLHKHGINVAKCQQSGQLHWLNVPQIGSNDSLNNTESSVIQSLLQSILTVAQSVKDTGSNSDVAVCIDDLLVLQLLSHSSNANVSEGNKQARMFISTLCSLLTSRKINTLLAYGKAYCESECSLMDATAYSQAPSATYVNNGNEDDLPLYAYCSYRSGVSVIISPLNTGYAVDIHGQIQVYSTRCSSGNSNGAASDQNAVFIYKALDSGVTCAYIKQ